MRKTFEYLYTVRAEDSIEVEDIGNCCIQVFNDSGYYWYLVITTELGWSHIKTFGPFYTEDEKYDFKKGFNFSYYIVEYKESKLTSTIDNFINDPKKMISQVLIVEDKNIALEDLLKVNFLEMRYEDDSNK